MSGKGKCEIGTVKYESIPGSGSGEIIYSDVGQLKHLRVELMMTERGIY